MHADGLVLSAILISSLLITNLAKETTRSIPGTLLGRWVNFVLNRNSNGCSNTSPCRWQCPKSWVVVIPNFQSNCWSEFPQMANRLSLQVELGAGSCTSTTVTNLGSISRAWGFGLRTKFIGHWPSFEGYTIGSHRGTACAQLDQPLMSCTALQSDRCDGNNFNASDIRKWVVGDHKHPAQSTLEIMLAITTTQDKRSCIGTSQQPVGRWHKLPMSIIFPNSHGMDLVLAFAKSAIRQERIQIADRTLSQSDCMFSRKRLIAQIEARSIVITVKFNTLPNFPKAGACFTRI